MNVKELRNKAGITQAELSEMTGIPRDRIAAWEQERGKPKAEDNDILRKFFQEFVPRENFEVHEDAASFKSKQTSMNIQNPNDYLQQILLHSKETNEKLADGIVECNRKLLQLMDELVKKIPDQSLSSHSKKVS